MAAAEPVANPLQKPVTTEDMKNFMEKVKKAIDEEKYQLFLDVVREYQGTGNNKLLEEMTVLLGVEPDLVKKLNHLLRMVPKPRSRWRSGFGYVCVGGFGLVLGIWAHLLF